MKQGRKLLFSTTLADCEIQTFCTGGPGGSKQNTTQAGVRLRHRESGAVGEARELRHQAQNKKLAFERMCKTKTFQTWARTKAAKMMGQKTTAERVDEAMAPHNLKTEVRDEGGAWQQVNPEDLESDRPCEDGCGGNAS